MAKDADFSQVGLLLHCDGTNVIDSSSSPRTLALYGNAAINTAQSAFGGASLYFDGAGDYLTVPSSAAFGFGTGDFTLEYFTYPTRTTGNETIFDARPSDSAVPLVLGRSSTGAARCYDGATVRTGGSVPVNEWSHVAWCRSGTSNVVYVRGVAAISFTGAFNCGTANGLTIGSNVLKSAENYQGYLDEIRITKGLARYTANFTPPAAPFPIAVDVSGVIRDASGSFAARLVRVMREDTGAFVSEVTSDATTGAYAASVASTGAHTVIAYPAGGESLPALVLRGVLPV